MMEGQSATTSASSSPELLHSLKHDSSVLSMTVSDEYIFTGTQNGEIVIWSLGLFQPVQRIQAHKRSVLCLFLSQPPSSASNSPSSSPPEQPGTSVFDKSQGLLFSSAADALISVWSPVAPFRRLFEIYSTYDVGDIFSVAYSRQLSTLYIGAQNTTIQWIPLTDSSLRVPHDNAPRHPDRRNHRFFDSKNLGGTSTPRRNEDRWTFIPRAQEILEVPLRAIRQFAHYGYVYCMTVAAGPTVLVEPDEDVLISGGGDGTIKLWRLGGRGSESDGGYDADGTDDDDSSVENGIEEIMCLGSDDGDSVLCLVVDGSFLYAGKLDGIVELWDLDTKQKLRAIVRSADGDVMRLNMAWGYLWSATSKGVASKYGTAHYGEYSGSVGKGGGPTTNVGQKYSTLATWQAHHGKILASAATTFRGDRLYITGANDNEVRVWAVKERRPGAGAKSSGAGGDSTATDGSEEDTMFASLREFVSYKTISSRPEFAEDCRRGARFLGSLFKRLGAQVEMLLSTSATAPSTAGEGGHSDMHNPVVYAKFSGKLEPAEKRKRILFYGHYDVVPADNRKGTWATDPFSLQGVNGHLYGRGVSDNKGPIMAALYAVTDLMASQRLDSDVVFLIEGEEESGSRGFQETVRQARSLIGRIDYVLLANSYWLDDSMPCLTYGLRGVLHATVCVDADGPDIHSGVDGSRLRDEPLADLTAVLARLRGPRNRVMLPGFYDGIPDITPTEEARYDDIAATLLSPEDYADERKREQLKASLKARWREPNLTLHRYKVSGPEGSLVSSHASAKVSLRLVPGQEVDEVAASLKRFLEDQFASLESGNRIQVRIDQAAEPWLGEPGNEIFSVLEAAVVKVWGGGDDGTGEESTREATTAGTTTAAAKTTATTSTGSGKSSGAKKMPLYIREGGSIPAIRFLEKEFGAPAAHLPCGQASDAAHLDNERLRVVNLLRSREIFAEVFARL